MPKTIKCNPSWEGSAQILLHVVEHGNTEQARRDAKEEILRAMRGYDAMLAEHTDYFDS